ncbi:MAG: hypothetical protein ABR980_00590 [Ignavibacteriaceae bacterium]|jgi:hypothetical protein
MNLNKVFRRIFYVLILISFWAFSIACHVQNDETGSGTDTSSTSSSEVSGSQETHKSFAVEKGQKLSIDLKSGGSISITGWEKNEVNVDAVFGGRDRDDIMLEIEKNSSGVEINSKYKHHHDNENSKAQFDIKVPVKFDVEINTMGGALAIDGVDGKISGQTMGGGLTLSKLKGYLDLSTMGGNISLIGSDVDGNVHTMGGNVDFENVTGDVKGSSMGGKVTMKNVTRKNGESKGDEVDISSMGGAIDVDDASNGANVSTMGGEISVHSAKKFVKAKTMGGNIEIDEVDGSVNAATMGGNINVKEICKPDDSDRNIDLQSSGGDITLLVPDGFSMDIDITLTITKNRDRDNRDYKIISDFDINRTQTDNWDYSKGSPRKYIHGKASIKGGKNKVKIETINGDVYLKKLD